MKSNHHCRLCGGAKLSTNITLKRLPVSHALRKSAADPDPRFDLAFANFVTLLSEAGFKFGPIHLLISSCRTECPALCAV